MADEASVRSSLQIVKDALQYYSRPEGFKADVVVANGPSPGATLVSVLGTDIDFSQLLLPGLCVLTNLDDTNFFEYGIFDHDTGAFYPLGEVQPGEQYVVRLSRNLGGQYTEVGTGSSDRNQTFRLRAYNQPIKAVVSAFDA